MRTLGGNGLDPPIETSSDQRSSAVNAMSQSETAPLGAKACEQWFADEGNFPEVSFFEGVQVFGATGSGKTAYTGCAIAERFKRSNFGGLVLTAKPGEFALWSTSSAYTYGFDKKKLVRFFPEGEEVKFNILQLAREVTLGGAGDIAQIFLAAISRGDTVVSAENPYWDNALRELLVHAIDLCILAEDSNALRPALTMPNIVAIIRGGVLQNGKDRTQLIQMILEKILEKEGTLEPCRKADLSRTAYFWLVDFVRLDERTRSNIISSFTSIAVLLDRSPLRELLLDPTVKSGGIKWFQDCRDGSVLLLDIPVKVYGETGRIAQVILKTLWQRFMEKEQTGDPNPVFLWADESQYFVTKEDALFQQTARSSKVATVYLTQSLSNYYAALGGDRSKAFVDSLLGNLRTKVFHANADPVTNEWAAKSFGEEYLEVKSRSGPLGQLVASKYTTETLSTQLRFRITTSSFVELQVGKAFVLKSEFERPANASCATQ
jgi:TraM recognition site of TraD and TraG